MTLKDLYSDKAFLNSISSIEKKILSQNIYGKLLIRSSLLDNENLVVLDNHSRFLNLSLSEIQRLIGPTNTNVSGFSCALAPFIFKTKLNSSLRFKSFMVYSNVISLGLVDTAYKSLFSLSCEDTSNLKSLLVLNPVKGGFVCYSSGVVGFLPRSHGMRLLAQTLFARLKDTTTSNIIPNLNFIIKTSHYTKHYFVLRLLFAFGKIVVYPQFKRNNFSASSRRKKRYFANDLNFVFLLPKVKKATV
jgi:hypothetical protein